jgi:hemerythrin HHE cation binding domain-containing protein
MAETTTGIPAQPTAPLADTSDMAQVHRVFREAIASAPAYIVSASVEGRARVDLVASYYLNVLALLHAHHDGEDELIWPKLVERAPDHALEVQRVAAQHGDVSPALDAASAALAGWERAADESSANVAAVAMAELGAVLLKHLDEEEEFIVPLAAQYITAPEWGELPGHALRNFAGDKLWLALGLVREQMRAEQLAMMDEHMPPPVVAMWREHEADFAGFVTALRGAS